MTKRSRRRALLVLGGVVALAACGGTDSESNAANTAESPTANESDANDSATLSSNDAANAVTPSASSDGAVTADFMVGKWSAMGEDCSDTIEFREDGTVATPIGDGKWTLTGDKLAFDYGDGSTQKPSTISVISMDRIEITKASGGKETQKRC